MAQACKRLEALEVPFQASSAVQDNHKGGKHKRNLGLQLGPLSPPRRMEVALVAGQAVPYEENAAEVGVVEAGTSAYSACRCMAISRKLPKPRRLCCA